MRSRSTAVKARDKSTLADEVAKQIAGLFEIENRYVIFDGACRLGNVVTARSLFFYVMFVRWNYSTTELEAITQFGRSAIGHAIQRMTDLLKEDRELQQKARVLGV